MQVTRYPEEIERVVNALAEINQSIDNLEWGFKLADDHVMETILTELDPETGKAKYTNETQRQLAANKLRFESARWNAARSELGRAQVEKARHIAYLERLRNEFKIALADKLNAKTFFINELAS